MTTPELTGHHTDHMDGGLIGEIIGALEPRSDKVDPLRVSIVGTDDEKNYTPEFGSYTNYVFGPATLLQVPVMILPQADKRSRAVIRVDFTHAVIPAAGDQLSYVVIGPVGSVANGQGFRMAPGSQMEITAEVAVYLFGGVTGFEISVSVLDERYR